MTRMFFLFLLSAIVTTSCGKFKHHDSDDAPASIDTTKNAEGFLFDHSWKFQFGEATHFTVNGQERLEIKLRNDSSQIGFFTFVVPATEGDYSFSESSTGIGGFVTRESDGQKIMLRGRLSISLITHDEVFGSLDIQGEQCNISGKFSVYAN